MKYLTIGIKANDLSEIENLRNYKEVAEELDNLKATFKVDIETKDLREEFKYAEQFLNENGLEDENSFFREFDINPYGLMIDFNLRSSQIDNELLQLVFSVALKISRVLNTECIFMINDMRDPVALFKNGEVIKEWNNV